nr:hypothetical protein [Chlamydiota bacterium]
HNKDFSEEEANLRALNPSNEILEKLNQIHREAMPSLELVSEKEAVLDLVSSDEENDRGTKRKDPPNDGGSGPRIKKEK